jgi:hypothetical protein
MVMPSVGIPEGAAHAYEVGVRSLEAQSRRVDSIDTKAAVILAVDGVLAGLLFDKGGYLGRAPKLLTSVVITLFLLSFLTALRALWTRKYATAPEFAAVMSFMVRDEQWLKWRFLSNIEKAEAENSEKLRHKVAWLKWSTWLLFVDVSLVGAYLLVAIWR